MAAFDLKSQRRVLPASWWLPIIFKKRNSFDWNKKTFGYETRMKRRSYRGFCGRVGWRTLLREEAWRYLRTPQGVIAVAALRIWSILSSAVLSFLTNSYLIEFFCGCKDVPTPLWLTSNCPVGVGMSIAGAFSGQFKGVNCTRFHPDTSDATSQSAPKGQLPKAAAAVRTVRREANEARQVNPLGHGKGRPALRSPAHHAAEGDTTRLGVLMCVMDLLLVAA